ncbi:hypothetical protein ILUMI_06886, partial [Ignelater luminosus]
DVALRHVHTILIKERHYTWTDSRPEAGIEKKRVQQETRVNAKEKGKEGRERTILDYLNELSKLQSIKVKSYGNSYEDRKLTLLEISTGGAETRPVIFIDGGIHGQEWISVAQVLYIIYSLAELQGNQQMIEAVDWVLVPVVNPDGYEYTQKTVSVFVLIINFIESLKLSFYTILKDRMWRKTRSKGTKCIGVDANQNFPYHWHSSGSNQDECKDTYSGPAPLSEPETKFLSEVLNSYKNRLNLYISFHSPAQAILYPWGSIPEMPKNMQALHHLAVLIEKTIAAMQGTAYKIGSSYNVLGPLAGSSRDWVFGYLNVKYSYIIELPSGGRKKFDLPPDKILSVVQETLLVDEDEVLRSAKTIMASGLLPAGSGDVKLSVTLVSSVDGDDGEVIGDRIVVLAVMHVSDDEKADLSIVAILDYLNELSKLEWINVKTYGNSYEKRNLTLVEIFSGDEDDEDERPVIFVDGGMHGQEWISVAQVLYIIHCLSEEEKNKYMAENVVWVLVPVVNPDGYEFTQNNDRLWRKTRSKGRNCIGVDINQNFPHHWQGSGSSKDECSDNYSGPVPLSELESRYLSEALESYKGRMALYLSFHSPALSILYPWGYTPELPPHVYQLHEVVLMVQSSIEAVRGTIYKMGTSYSVLGPLAGCSRDWVYGFLKVRLSFMVDLPSGGSKKIDLPPDKISEVVEEMFVGVREFHAYVLHSVKASEDRLPLTSKVAWICWYASVVICRFIFQIY